MAGTRIRNGLAVAAIGVALFATLGEAGSTSTSTGNQTPGTGQPSATSNVTGSAKSSGAAGTSAASTTALAAPAAPAAPDASPYVEGFGDLSALSLPAGDPGVLSIVKSNPTLNKTGSVPIIVRNNTSKAVGQIDIIGTARDEAGKLVGSGDSQVSFQPRIVAPGEIALGYVYFGSDSPAGSALQFTFEVKSEPPGTYFVPLTISELNNTGTKILGAVKNGSGGKVTGPIEAEVFCFGTDGSFVGQKKGFAEQMDLPDGGTGTFSINLSRDPCPVGLVASSAFGHF